MRRGVSFVAAGITAFTLVILVSIAYAYQVMAAPRTTQAVPASQSAAAIQLPVSESAAIVAAPVAKQLSAREAAALASTLLGRTDAYSVELGNWQGTAAYKVTFSSGDVAYISLDGQLLATVPFTQSIVMSTGGGRGGGEGGGGGGHRQDDGGGSEPEHEQEHEGND